MRNVCLESAGYVLQNKDSEDLERLTGHLLARMSELEECGLVVSRQRSERIVNIRFTKLDNREAVACLKQKYGIMTGYDASGDLICMHVTPSVSFEDMDYVQGAVTELLFQ